MPRRYDEKGNLLARSSRAPRQAARAPAPAPVATMKPKTIDEINELFRAAARGARIRALAYLHEEEMAALRVRRRVR